MIVAGDELDADLVEYMVSVKQTDPHGHLTASQALQIAKQYILEKVRSKAFREKRSNAFLKKSKFSRKEIEFRLPDYWKNTAVT